jgi:hypothetical protein
VEGQAKDSQHAVPFGPERPWVGAVGPTPTFEEDLVGRDQQGPEGAAMISSAAVRREKQVFGVAKGVEEGCAIHEGHRGKQSLFPRWKRRDVLWPSYRGGSRRHGHSEGRYRVRDDDFIWFKGVFGRNSIGREHIDGVVGLSCEGVYRMFGPTAGPSCGVAGVPAVVGGEEESGLCRGVEGISI